MPKNSYLAAELGLFSKSSNALLMPATYKKGAHKERL
jgi:hypothetical protein